MSFQAMVDQLCIGPSSPSKSPPVLAPSSTAPSFCDLVNDLCKEPLTRSLPPPPSPSSPSSFPSFHDLLERLHHIRPTPSPSISSLVTPAPMDSHASLSSDSFLDLVRGYSQLYQATHGSNDEESDSDTGGSSFASDLDREREPLPLSEEDDEEQTREPLSREHVAS
ncbi:hypothetical protein BS17DRAFT_823501 [Gyrodon lividus]|nr:hypothetical protein BS17DRAFT_823501 [Gyrodon lividus]